MGQAQVNLGWVKHRGGSGTGPFGVDQPQVAKGGQPQVAWGGSATGGLEWVRHRWVGVGQPQVDWGGSGTGDFGADWSVRGVSHRLLGVGQPQVAWVQQEWMLISRWRVTGSQEKQRLLSLFVPVHMKSRWSCRTKLELQRLRTISCNFRSTILSLAESYKISTHIDSRRASCCSS